MYVWEFEVILYGNETTWVTVTTETDNYYEAERKVLSLPDVWDVGYACNGPHLVSSAT